MPSALLTRLPVLAVPARGRALALSIEWHGLTVPILVVRLPRSGFQVFLNRCPHFGVALDGPGGTAFDGRGRQLLCSLHGATFRPEDGFCLTGPCAGDNLAVLEAVELFGELQVFIPPAVAEDVRRRAAVSEHRGTSEGLDGLGPDGPDDSTDD